MTRRAPTVSFFPDFWVFPGGKIEDPLPESWEGTEFEVIETVFRELYEETGIVVGSDWIVPPEKRKESFFVQNYNEEKRREFKEQMEYVGKKVTPPFSRRIYSAAYYHIQGQLVDELQPQVDNGELIEGEWIQPSVAVSQWRKGDKKIPPPILQLLKNLQSEHFASISLSETFLSVGLQTKIEFAPGFQLIPIASDTIDPFTNTNLIIIGETEFLVVDPGANDAGKQHLREMLLTLPATPQILLTHHHPDHWQGLDIVEDLFPESSVLGHPSTLDRISTALTKKPVQDGDRIDLGEQSVEILDLPGHTDGHIGLYNPTFEVLVAGDHVVGFGSAVLDPETGSMIDYFKSLYRLQELELRMILPAHGPPNFAPQKLLRQYIQHRKEREEAIWQAIQNGKYTLDQIVEEVYQDVPEKMWSFAKRNIQLHLEKLNQERTLPDEIISEL